MNVLCWWEAWDPGPLPPLNLALANAMFTVLRQSTKRALTNFRSGLTVVLSELRPVHRVRC